MRMTRIINIPVTRWETFLLINALFWRLPLAPGRPAPYLLLARQRIVQQIIL